MELVKISYTGTFGITCPNPDETINKAAKTVKMYFMDNDFDQRTVIFLNACWYLYGNLVLQNQTMD